VTINSARPRLDLDLRIERDDETSAFFEATAADRLLLWRCPDGHLSSAIHLRCETCGSRDLVAAAASGIAQIVTWAVIPSRVEDEPPIVLAVGELVEGPWWWARIVGADPADLCPGTTLAIAFATAGAERIPVFRVA
jgi:uncharacterized OB-fold protein